MFRLKKKTWTNDLNMEINQHILNQETDKKRAIKGEMV